jgi:cell division protein FtsB
MDNLKVKDQELSEREERGRVDSGMRRKALTLASILLLVAFVVGSFFGDRGILRLLSQEEQAQVLRQQIDALRAENASLASEIVALRSDPRAVERLARERLGLARPGETVFLIREDESGTP